METKIKCPWCDQEYTVDSSLVGQTVKCEICEKRFTARNTLFNSLPSNSVQNKKSFYASSNSIKNPSSKKKRDNTGWKWIADFFDFKIMVTPVFIRMSFIFLFIIGSCVILIYPFVTIWKNFGTKSIWSILLFGLGYVIYAILSIPLFAVISHTFYELTMIPFSILNVLTEIRNKLDEKTKS